MKTIGFIGVGIMGKPMVRNLMKKGFTVRIYARNAEKVRDVIAEGALFFPTISQCVETCGAVITMVGFPPDVEDVYFGKDHIFDSAAPGTYLIDMTTTSPSLAARLYETGTAKGFHVLDAPVTGGETGAVKGTLSILAGGDKDDFDACLPLFQALGTNINYQGKAGSGQHAKLANQIIIAGTLSGICEAFTYAKAKGLDLKVLLRSLKTGAAGSAQLDALGEKMIDGNYEPGFYIKHFIKDMMLADEEARFDHLPLNVLRLVLGEYEVLAAEEGEDNGELGTQGLMKFYENA